VALARQYACAEVPAVGEAWEDVALNECKVCVCVRERECLCVCVWFSFDSVGVLWR
jgi:hypothetical protein